MGVQNNNRSLRDAFQFQLAELENGGNLPDGVLFCVVEVRTVGHQLVYCAPKGGIRYFDENQYAEMSRRIAADNFKDFLKRYQTGTGDMNQQKLIKAIDLSVSKKMTQDLMYQLRYQPILNLPPNTFVARLPGPDCN